MSNFIALYALTFFFANWGPNSTTYILPSELFPARFRSSAHGFCAAMGKAGAITGVFGFGILKDTPTSNAGLQVRAPPPRPPTLIPELRIPNHSFTSSFCCVCLQLARPVSNPLPLLNHLPTRTHPFARRRRRWGC